MYGFTWNLTPEGHTFWSNVYRGDIPVTPDIVARVVCILHEGGSRLDQVPELRPLLDNNAAVANLSRTVSTTLQLLNNLSSPEDVPQTVREYFSRPLRRPLSYEIRGEGGRTLGVVTVPVYFTPPDHDRLFPDPRLSSHPFYSYFYGDTTAPPDFVTDGPPPLPEFHVGRYNHTTKTQHLPGLGTVVGFSEPGDEFFDKSVEYVNSLKPSVSEFRTHDTAGFAVLAGSQIIDHAPTLLRIGFRCVLRVLNTSSWARGKGGFRYLYLFQRESKPFHTIGSSFGGFSVFNCCGAAYVKPRPEHKKIGVEYIFDMGATDLSLYLTPADTFDSSAPVPDGVTVVPLMNNIVAITCSPDYVNFDGVPEEEEEDEWEEF